jgi:alkanesulfonate monooxygenase SsuD/methylene tetrahydromethanopterin reductase-like flavin-dependent oxidoreductase (luciferase family)
VRPVTTPGSYLPYPNIESLTALAAAAAVTERIGLATTVLLGPLRENPVAVAKQVASIHSPASTRSPATG